MKWESIDTAPKDGSRFVALQGGKTPCVMQYNRFQKDFVRTVTCRRCDGMGLGSLTHWAELPELPNPTT